MDNTTPRRDGFYWVEGRPYISVTEVLKVIAKPAIQYWYGQQVYQTVIVDPTIDERTALAAPYLAGKKASDRGTTVHSIVEAYRKNKVKVETVPELQGYADAFYSWANDLNPTVVDSERIVFNKHLGYAGRFDMLAEIGGKQHIIDFKTSKRGDIYDEAHMQVSAYLECMEGVEDGMIVALAQDGHYAVQTARDGFEAFAHALGLYAFINEEKLAKYGWKGEV